MTEISRSVLHDLVDHRSPNSVSLYMPTHPAGADTRQDPIRLKNLLRAAVDELTGTGLTEGHARERLTPAAALLEDGDFWRHQANGLAVFVDDGRRWVYRVPLEVEERVFVGDRFYLKPLLPLLGNSDAFFLLALSQNDVRLLQATRHDVHRVPLDNAPRCLAELSSFYDFERHIQFHTGSAAHRVGARRAATFHGQGVGTDETADKTRIREFCRLVEVAVRKGLADRSVPLVLAAADPLVGLYREVNTYPHLHSSVLHGNYERASDADIHREAVRALSSVFDQPRLAAAAEYRRLAGGKLASCDLQEVLRAAFVDRVDTLFVSMEDYRWGRFDPEHGMADIHGDRQPADEDLLDLAAVRALRGKGGVFAVARGEMPAESPIAATFRF